MNVKIDQLVQSVLQKKTLTECSIAELQNLAEQYPYSSAMQLLFTAKLKTTDQGKFKLQLQKASLFFNNPLWLKHLLYDGENLPVVTEQKQEDQQMQSTEQVKEEQKSFIEIPLLKIEKPDSSKQELTFEPYH
ncbi:MAG: hypothetical protein ACRDE5_12200, partial [Ginsengibacter sp.]